jgi:hypothetical protein
LTSGEAGTTTSPGALPTTASGAATVDTLSGSATESGSGTDNSATASGTDPMPPLSGVNDVPAPSLADPSLSSRSMRHPPNGVGAWLALGSALVSVFVAIVMSTHAV